MIKGSILNLFFTIVLNDGKIGDITCFIELEEIEFPLPVGQLEAFTTAVGTSKAPRAFEGQLKTTGDCYQSF